MRRYTPSYHSPKPQYTPSVSPPPIPSSQPVYPDKSKKIEAWEDGRFWHSLKEASPILVAKCGNGYQYHSFAQRIRRGYFQEGYHFRRIGRAIEVNIWRIIEG